MTYPSVPTLDGVPAHPVVAVGTLGTDYSSSKGVAALPSSVGQTIGTSTYGGSGPYAAYILVAQVAAQPGRINIDVENNSGAQIVVVRDDGTAAVTAAPVNASAFALAGGAGVGSQGGSWSSTTFKGRISVWAPASTAQVAVMVD